MDVWNYKINPSLSTAGVDYLRQDIVVTFEPEISSLDIVIPLINDDVMETTKEFSLSLELVDGVQSSTLVSPSTATVAIHDDDGVWKWNTCVVSPMCSHTHTHNLLSPTPTEVSVSISVTSSVISESTESVVVQVTLTGETQLPVSVLLSTLDGSASGERYAYTPVIIATA